MRPFPSQEKADQFAEVSESGSDNEALIVTVIPYCTLYVRYVLI